MLLFWAVGECGWNGKGTECQKPGDKIAGPGYPSIFSYLKCLKYLNTIMKNNRTTSLFSYSETNRLGWEWPESSLSFHTFNWVSHFLQLMAIYGNVNRIAGMRWNATSFLPTQSLCVSTWHMIFACVPCPRFLAWHHFINQVGSQQKLWLLPGPPSHTHK